MEKILINRTRMNKVNWLKMKQIAEIKGTTREELLDKLVDVYLKNIRIKIGTKDE